MAYKDKDKQREAQRDWVRQKREGSTKKGSTGQGSTKGITEAERDEAIEFMAKTAGEAERAELKPELTAQGNIRVSKPGDDDYVPQCETTRAFIEGRDKRPETGKRGKDIKCFADLPPDVQEVIHRLSTIDGKIDPRVKANRTAIAINYQHLFPDRYHGTGPWALEDTGVA